MDGEWVGFDHFIRFFDSYYFWNVLRNTFLISFYNLLFGFPAAILLALLMNELKNGLFKRIVQTVSYLPHFISTVVVAGLIMMMLSTDNGLLNAIVVFLAESRFCSSESPNISGLSSLYLTCGKPSGGDDLISGCHGGH